MVIKYFLTLQWKNLQDTTFPHDKSKYYHRNLHCISPDMIYWKKKKNMEWFHGIPDKDA
jgi:hypothetical protein